MERFWSYISPYVTLRQTIADRFAAARAVLTPRAHMWQTKYIGCAVDFEEAQQVMQQIAADVHGDPPKAPEGGSRSFGGAFSLSIAAMI